MTQRKTVLCIFGTRPEAIKMVPVIRALQSSNWAHCIVVVTAQHRDLLDQMLTRFGIAVDYDLNIMQPKQSLNSVLARMLPELAGIIQTEQPYAVLAQGDTATVFGAALAAFHAQVPFGHIKAGLHTHDLQHGVKDVLQRLAKVFAPVGGQQDKTTCLLAGRWHVLHGLQQGVYAGVADDMDFAGVYAFFSQGVGGILSGCKVPLGDARDHLAIALFREWVLQIMGA